MSAPLSLHSGSILARNAVLGFVAQAVPRLVALVAVPILIRGLGTQVFGAFQLTWTVLGYFAIFDLGLGQAATKFVAEHFAREEPHLMREAVTAALAVQVVTAIVGGGLFALLVPVLIPDVVKVPADLAPQMSASFYLLLAALPAVLLGATYSGVLQAVQRFDLIAGVQALSSIATFGLPIAALGLGAGLTGVVGTVVAVRLATCLVYALLAYRVLPGQLRLTRLTWRSCRRLAAFGGWVSVSNIATPLMEYSDRYVIAALLGLSAVAHYTAPYDVVVRLTIVPAGLMPPLFSAFSALGGVGDQHRLTQLFSRAAKYLLLTMAPLALSLIVFARPGLDLWLGEEFAEHSTLPTQILAVGMAVNAMAHLPYGTLQAVGRPDLPAKFHLLELPVYGALLAVLVPRFGITGAALAWSARMTLDAALLYRTSLSMLPAEVVQPLGRAAKHAALPLLLFASLLLAFAMSPSLGVRLVGAVVAALVAGVTAWRVALDERERSLLAGLVMPGVPKGQR